MTQWAVRVQLRDGTSRLIGPVASKDAARELQNKLHSQRVVFIGPVKLKSRVKDGVRVLQETRFATPAAENEEPSGIAEDLVVEFNTETYPDVVLITSAQADFPSYATIDWVSTGGSGTLTRDVDSVLVDPDIITINMDPGEFLTSLTIRDASSAVIATWTGSVDLTPVVVIQLTNWAIHNGDFLANEVELQGSGFLTVGYVEVLDAQGSPVSGTTFTVLDDNTIVIHWASGEIIPTTGWNIGEVGPTNSLTAIWALGTSIDESTNPDTSINPLLDVQNGSVRILDINGLGNFDTPFVRIDLVFSNGVATYLPVDLAWAVTDGGNSITITDAVEITSGRILNNVQLHAPTNGSIPVNPPFFTAVP